METIQRVAVKCDKNMTINVFVSDYSVAPFKSLAKGVGIDVIDVTLSNT